MNVCSHSLLGDNINKLGRNNNTPLHYACSQNRVQVVEYIICIHYEFSIEKCLVHGGNPHAVNSQGKNPYDLTADTHFTLKQMLLKYMYQTPEGQSMQPQLDTVTGFTQAKEEAEEVAPPPPPPMGSMVPPPTAPSAQENLGVFLHPALAKQNARASGYHSHSQFKPIPTTMIVQSTSVETVSESNEPACPPPETSVTPFSSNPLLASRKLSSHSSVEAPATAPAPAPVVAPVKPAPVKPAFGLASKGPRRQINYTRYIPHNHTSLSSSAAPQPAPQPAPSTSINEPAIISVSTTSRPLETPTPAPQAGVFSPFAPMPSSFTPSRPAPVRSKPYIHSLSPSRTRKTRGPTRLMDDGFITTVGHPV